jgi:MFS family permease
VLLVRLGLGEQRFQAWGWRLPFLFSAALLLLSLWIRLKLGESPEYQRMRSRVAAVRAPLKEALRGANGRRILQALFCILLAQGAVWYTGHFYAQFFLERVLKVDARLVNLLVMAGVTLSAAGYVFFGWLSDRVGRKPVMLAGMGVCLLAYFPAFHGLTAAANPALAEAARRSPVFIEADPRTCRVQFDLLSRRPPRSECDVIRTTLADAGVPYRLVAAGQGAVASVRIGAERVAPGSLENLDAARRASEIAHMAGTLKSALKAAGYPTEASRDSVRIPAVLGILLLLMLASTALYGPQAAALVELFPTSIRYTALSVPYNIGTGWIGGLLPVSAFALVAASGDIYSGLFYPLVFTAISFVCCWLWWPETSGRPLQMTGESDA